MPARKRLLIGGLILAGLAGCAAPEVPMPSIASIDLAPSVTLASVPFHPQAERDDCGPAALAMMLGATGIDTDPATIAPAVYTPGLEGTLQSDIIQAARRAGRLALPISSLKDLLTELDAGRPVLVLQNLGIERWPVWHYAVAVGYDLDSSTLFLHSGREARHATSFLAFERTWQSSDRWGLTVTLPGELPSTASEAEGLDAANGLEQAGEADAAAAAYGALLERWPESLPALMGFGNARYAAGDIETAQQAFRQAVALHPKAAEAWNNLAVTLKEEGRHADAVRAAVEAVRLGGPNREIALATLTELKDGAE